MPQPPQETSRNYVLHGNGQYVVVSGNGVFRAGNVPLDHGCSLESCPIGLDSYLSTILSCCSTSFDFLAQRTSLRVYGSDIARSPKCSKISNHHIFFSCFRGTWVTTPSSEAVQYQLCRKQRPECGRIWRTNRISVSVARRSKDAGTRLWKFWLIKKLM